MANLLTGAVIVLVAIGVVVWFGAKWPDTLSTAAVGGKGILVGPAKHMCHFFYKGSDSPNSADVSKIAGSREVIQCPIGLGQTCGASGLNLNYQNGDCNWRYDPNIQDYLVNACGWSPSAKACVGAVECVDSTGCGAGNAGNKGGNKPQVAVCDPVAGVCTACANYFKVLYNAWEMSGEHCQSESQSTGGSEWLYVRSAQGCIDEVGGMQPSWQNYVGLCVEVGDGSLTASQTYCPSYTFLGRAVQKTDCVSGETGEFMVGNEPILDQIDFTAAIFTKAK
ncbi:MAG: hypothetical protein V1744_06400 [Candidatus Altiarchaeota archaeon]